MLLLLLSYRRTVPTLPKPITSMRMAIMALLHIDHARPFMGKLYLIVVNAYSRWMYVSIVSSTSAEVTIQKLCSLFATHGVPEQPCQTMGHGSGFASEEFKKFTQLNGIRHTFTSPYDPSLNGLAEWAVQSFKHGVSKLSGSMENSFYSNIE